MGIKGKLAWAVKIDKVSKTLFQATYRELMNFLMSTSESVDDINTKMKDIGFRVGETLLMDYADKIREHAVDFAQFSKTLQLAYKVNSGQEFTDVSISGDERTIKFTDANCPICEGVLIEDMPGLQYCVIVSGVFDAVMKLRGFSAESYQESCKALGDDVCTWTLNLRD
jgi:predicted hydrocarbon binding protein